MNNTASPAAYRSDATDAAAAAAASTPVAGAVAATTSTTTAAAVAAAAAATPVAGAVAATTSTTTASAAAAATIRFAAAATSPFAAAATTTARNHPALSIDTTRDVTSPTTGNSNSNTLHPSAAAAAAAAAAARISMTVSTVDASVRASSPIISTANQVNAKTTAKRKVNKQGDLVAAVSSTQPKIKPGIRVFSTREQLIVHMKQGDPAYNIVNNVGKGFRFYGKVSTSDKKKGWYNVEYDLFPTDARSLRLPRTSLTTMRQGQEEPQYDKRHDKVEQVLADLELLEPDPEDFDLVLPDSDEDEEEDNSGGHKKKSKRKKTRKVLSLESFINMSDESVLAATTFNHYYGEDDNDFIQWTILQEGEEIVDDVMIHEENKSPYKIDIPWKPDVRTLDYCEIFFKYFFPPLEGKAALLDKYLSDPRCSGHTAYYINEKVRFHRPHKPDPDYLVSLMFVLLQ